MTNDQVSPDPDQEMPTLEEVKAWLRAREERSRQGVLVNPSGSGIADHFRMVDAEKHYRELGLLLGLR